MGKVLDNCVNISHIQDKLLHGLFDDETQFKLTILLRPAENLWKFQAEAAILS